jgi:hypothetical protein
MLFGTCYVINILSFLFTHPLYVLFSTYTQNLLSYFMFHILYHSINYYAQIVQRAKWERIDVPVQVSEPANLYIFHVGICRCVLLFTCTANTVSATQAVRFLSFILESTVGRTITMAQARYFIPVVIHGCVIGNTLSCVRHG